MNKKGILITIGLAALAGIGMYFKRQLNYLADATSKIIGAKIHNVGIGNIRFTLYIKIQNKGDISALITDQNYEIFANDFFVSKIHSQTEIHLKSNGDTLIPLEVEFNPSNVFLNGVSNLSAIIQDKSKLKFLVKGKLSLQAGIVALKDYTFEISMTLAEITAMSNKPQ